MPNDQPTIRLGHIVRTPPGAVYGDALAIVTAIRKGAYETAITVHSQRAELVYEPEQLRVVATIKILRSYPKPPKRFTACRVEPQGIELHVCVGERGSYETRALEVRKLVFIELLKRIEKADAPST